MQDAALQLTCYGHPIMQCDADSMRIIYRNIKEPWRHTAQYGQDTPTEIAYACYLAIMTVACGCLITEGTPISLIELDGTTVVSSIVAGPIEEPRFGATAAHQHYVMAKQARIDGLSKLELKRSDLAIEFAVNYGWLAGSQSPESDAWLASQTMLARRWLKIA